MRATLNVCPQILVTHHVELVLPGANYLVRMLDGRIDLQGSVQELQDRGLLEVIAADAAAEEEPFKESDTKEKEAIGEKEAKEGEDGGRLMGGSRDSLDGRRELSSD